MPHQWKISLHQKILQELGFRRAASRSADATVRPVASFQCQPKGERRCSEAEDSLLDTEALSRDIEQLETLGINTTRVHTIDRSDNHDEAMRMLDEAGRRPQPCKPGSSLPVNTPKNINAAPYIKAVTRDNKRYINAQVECQIPVGYSVADFKDNVGSNGNIEPNQDFERSMEAYEQTPAQAATAVPAPTLRFHSALSRPTTGECPPTTSSLRFPSLPSNTSRTALARAQASWRRASNTSKDPESSGDSTSTGSSSSSSSSSGSSSSNSNSDSEEESENSKSGAPSLYVGAASLVISFAAAGALLL
ncbi:hypothetical protein D0869_11234 [Hortaea werneckii]|uniref:1,3-beta-glucanosyltransferase n=1 Tax=Hortaea werneckii TaxID=91943 RepID=A0A3M6WBW3_HORWE|nr:hypothetical protein D0869_11234 [Hortaea werneckii]